MSVQPGCFSFSPAACQAQPTLYHPRFYTSIFSNTYFLLSTTQCIFLFFFLSCTLPNLHTHIFQLLLLLLISSQGRHFSLLIILCHALVCTVTEDGVSYHKIRLGRHPQKQQAVTVRDPCTGLTQNIPSLPILPHICIEVTKTAQCICTINIALA